MRSRAFEFACASVLALVFGSIVSATLTACSSRTGSAGSSQAGASQRAARAPAPLPPGVEWAAWINRDIELTFQGLPQTYTCDGLWYKLRAILLAIGAREYMSIERYDCGKNASAGGSQRVHLRFFTLRPVTGDQIRWANTRAVEKTVVLAPGQPDRLEPKDCALVQQLKGSLFPYLDVPVTSSRFECSTPSAHNFELSARVIVRWPDEAATK